jgi:hypothetical protein
LTEAEKPQCGFSAVFRGRRFPQKTLIHIESRKGTALRRSLTVEVRA